MASDIWLRTILIVRKETRCRHIGYSYRLTARVLLYAPSHRQDNTYLSLCYTSRGALVGTRNRSMGRIGLESTGRWSNGLGSLSPKCHYEYQEMRRGWPPPYIHILGSATGSIFRTKQEKKIRANMATVSW